VSKPITVVTGGSRGIGRAIVEDLSATHRVVATYNSNLAAAQSVARAKTGAELLQWQLADLSSCRAPAEEIAVRFGSVDMLVNNAGMAPRERRDILKSARARMRAAKQRTNSLSLRAARLLPRPFCACSSKATPESFDELFAANLRGPYFLTQYLSRSMLARNRAASSSSVPSPASRLLSIEAITA
jgi:NAD(P)-dependent dehydrogenase (short-subunit alcohol dehydrogenase family)